jgi:hypothetical protein
MRWPVLTATAVALIAACRRALRIRSGMDASETG